MYLTCNEGLSVTSIRRTF